MDLEEILSKVLHDSKNLGKLTEALSYDTKAHKMADQAIRRVNTIAGMSMDRSTDQKNEDGPMEYIQDQVHNDIQDDTMVVAYAKAFIYAQNHLDGIEEETKYGHGFGKVKKLFLSKEDKRNIAIKNNIIQMSSMFELAKLVQDDIKERYELTPKPKQTKKESK